MYYIILGLLTGYILTGVYYRYKKTPPGINGYEAEYPVNSNRIEFLYDLTFFNENRKITDRNILLTCRRCVRQARGFILFDIFLFNDLKADYTAHDPITALITNDLSKKRIPRWFITDPLNTSYGTNRSKALVKLTETGTKIIYTDIKKLPDNNLLYSPFWRLFCQWFDARGTKNIPHPLDKKKRTTLRAILMGLNAKANHRKLLIADSKTVVSSSNLHDASSNYGNTGVLVDDACVASHFLGAERAVVEMSGHGTSDWIKPAKKLPAKASGNTISVKPLMGKTIKKEIIKDLLQITEKDKVCIGMLFLAHRQALSILKQKSRAGADICVILDNNKVSFEREKIGMPNHFIAPELIRAGAKVYMTKSRDDEYHSKFIYIKKQKTAILHTGSANLTRRSLLGTNLENNIRLRGPAESRVFREVEKYCKKATNKKCAEKFKGRPKIYAAGYIWTRMAERLGFANW